MYEFAFLIGTEELKQCTQRLAEFVNTTEELIGSKSSVSNKDFIHYFFIIPI